MARVTVEDCVDKVQNRFDLVLLAAHRARVLSSGSTLAIAVLRRIDPFERTGEMVIIAGKFALAKRHGAAQIAMVRIIVERAQPFELLPGAVGQHAGFVILAARDKVRDQFAA